MPVSIVQTAPQFRRDPRIFERWRATPTVWVQENGDRVYIPKEDYEKYLCWEIGRVSSVTRVQQAH